MRKLPLGISKVKLYLFSWLVRYIKEIYGISRLVQHPQHFHKIKAIAIGNKVSNTLWLTVCADFDSFTFLTNTVEA